MTSVTLQPLVAQISTICRGTTINEQHTLSAVKMTGNPTVFFFFFFFASFMAYYFIQEGRKPGQFQLHDLARSSGSSGQQAHNYFRVDFSDFTNVWGM